MNVKYDPSHKNHVVILGEAATPPGHHAAPSQPTSPAVNPSPDVARELSQLSKLHKSGELSDSEFAAAKKKLLG